MPLLPSSWIPPVHDPSLLGAGMKWPYWRCFLTLPLCVSQVLVAEGYTAVQTDGETLQESLTCPEYFNGLLNRLLQEWPPPHSEELKGDLECLLKTLVAQVS